MNFALRKPWWLAALALGLWQGCGEPKPPQIGRSLVTNGSFEAGLAPWWNATDSTGGTATVIGEAADSGTFGLKLHKGTGGWGSMVGQETLGHAAGQTFQVYARIKGEKGGEHVTFSYHGEGFEVVAEDRWRTVDRLLFMPEVNGNSSAIVSVTTDEATVSVDEVSFAQAVVERGDADEEEDNLLRNGSFESGLGLWNFWADAPENVAYTSPDARHSGYSGMVLTLDGGSMVSVKQQLPDPVTEREEYRVEARVRGAHGEELVNLCLQINHEPWDGPCNQVTAYIDWQHVSRTFSIDAALADERVGLLISMGSPGSVMLDDVVVVRTRKSR
jgi:Carbohydrate binding domain